MSTKTTFKRIALVAVAALGFGVLSVVPSNATINADTLTLSATTASQTTAETLTATSASATLKFLGAIGDSASVTASLVSGPGAAFPYLSLAETASATIDAQNRAVGYSVGSNTAVVVASGSASAFATAKFNVFLASGTDNKVAPTVAGTYVVKITPASVGASGALQAATAQNITITVTTAPTLDTVAASATSIINQGETTSATADDSVTFAKGITSELTSSRAAAATITVALKNAAGSATTSESFTAVIAGPGLLGSSAIDAADTTPDDADPVGRAITVKAGHMVQVFNDGTSGVATITISSAAGKVLATETVTFYGDAASVAVTVKKPVIAVASSATAGVLLAVVKDASGTVIQNASLNVVSSDTAKIAGAYTATGATYSATDGGYLIGLQGLVVGTTNITVTTKSSATATTGVDAAAVAVRVGSSTPASLSVTLDKAAYAPGEVATITMSLKDADGLDLADGNYNSIFATGGISASYSLGAGSDTTTGTYVYGLASGKATYKVYMPVTEGDVKFSWTTGSVAATSGAGLATANQAKAGSVTVTVSSPSTAAATDAANEATDAANAATDAALAAAEAADAATTAAQEASDAVAALSESVTKLIAGLQAQIKSLAAVVAKIAKKVKA